MGFLAKFRRLTNVKTSNENCLEFVFLYNNRMTEERISAVPTKAKSVFCAAVDPVVQGKTRAEQFYQGDTDGKKVDCELCCCVHVYQGSYQKLPSGILFWANFVKLVILVKPVLPIKVTVPEWVEAVRGAWKRGLQREKKVSFAFFDFFCRMTYISPLQPQ